MVLGFYVPLVPEKRFEYFKGELPAQGPEWFIRHSREGLPSPSPVLVVENRLHYTLARHFPGSGISGWHWYLYRRVEEQ